ncbi:amidohydrolase [Salsuginibacillus kocurii]|uniref:amidohydrolase n=1 Tax=Salsuginibacillus kocurii TaxID=427078 RepID=UPI000365C81D|nr:amidohydrolase [Salsuginibacillus kocurii]
MKAYINATLLNEKGEWVEGQALLVDGTKIKDVLSLHEVPAEAEKIDVNGLTITPGLIDVHTHLGVHEESIGKPGADFNETSDPATPEVRALDGLNPREEGFLLARSCGVTTVQVLPGSANVIGGEMCTVKTAGHIVDEMIVQSPSGMKAAFGENPKRVYEAKGKKPITRMGVAAVFRENLIKAQNYKRKLENGESLDRDLGMEQLVKVLNKEIPLRVHAHRADDMVTVLRLAEEFDVNLTLEHGTEGHHIADYVGKHDVSVSVGPTMTPKIKVEVNDKQWETLQELENNGVNVAITTDHPVISIEHFVTGAAKAHNAGFPESSALRAITINAAKHLGLEDRLGSLEAGKDADFVIWNGHPFDYRTTVQDVFIEGKDVLK